MLIASVLLPGYQTRAYLATGVDGWATVSKDNCVTITTTSKNDSDHRSQDQLLSDIASRRELAAPAPPAEQAGLAYAVGCTCPAFLTYLTLSCLSD